jgi:hypothetical protein
MVQNERAGGQMSFLQERWGGLPFHSVLGVRE